MSICLIHSLETQSVHILVSLLKSFVVHNSIEMQLIAWSISSMCAFTRNVSTPLHRLNFFSLIESGKWLKRLLHVVCSKQTKWHAQDKQIHWSIYLPKYLDQNRQYSSSNDKSCIKLQCTLAWLKNSLLRQFLNHHTILTEFVLVYTFAKNSIQKWTEKITPNKTQQTKKFHSIACTINISDIHNWCCRNQ